MPIEIDLVVPTNKDLYDWDNFPISGELQLNSIGLCKLYDNFKRFTYLGLKVAHEKAKE